MADDGQDSTKSPLHPAVVNSDKHVDNIKKSIESKRSAAEEATLASVRKSASQKVNATKVRNADKKNQASKDPGKREKGYY